METQFITINIISGDTRNALIIRKNEGEQPVYIVKGDVDLLRRRLNLCLELLANWK